MDIDGSKGWEPYDALVLAFTPGVPIEWVRARFKLGLTRRRQLRDLVRNADVTRLTALGKANAESVVKGDGLAMIEAVCPGYAGAAPLWTQIELQQDPRTDVEIARILGVDRQKVRRWRVNHIFDPLTGGRLVPPRGDSSLLGKNWSDLVT